MGFKVMQIIDGNTIEVSPNWKWLAISGYTVKIVGYRPPTGEFGDFVKAKLSILILGQTVELKNPISVNDNELNCFVYLNNINISLFFSDLK